MIVFPSSSDRSRRHEAALKTQRGNGEMEGPRGCIFFLSFFNLLLPLGSLHRKPYIYILVRTMPKTIRRGFCTLGTRVTLWRNGSSIFHFLYDLMVLTDVIGGFLFPFFLFSIGCQQVVWWYATVIVSSTWRLMMIYDDLCSISVLVWWFVHLVVMLLCNFF